MKQKKDEVLAEFFLAAKQANALDLDLSRLQDPSASPHLLHKRYSELYFTWKIPEKGSARCELHGRKNAEDES